MGQILFIYAVTWLACLALSLIVETVRLRSTKALPRWVKPVGWICAVGLTAPVLIITLPFWLPRLRAQRSGR